MTRSASTALDFEMNVTAFLVIGSILWCLVEPHLRIQGKKLMKGVKHIFVDARTLRANKS